MRLLDGGIMTDVVLRDMLIRHEGYRLKPYKCPAGRFTIGVGHNIDANPLPNGMGSYLAAYGEITGQMVDDLLSADVENALMDCRHLYPKFDKFSVNRQRALIDFMFNVGIGTARKFRNANSAINRGDWYAASVEMRNSQWYVQVKDRAEEICEMIREG